MSAAATTTSVLERELIAAARAGDEDAYRRLVEPRHAELHAHCYRMLGSVHDAEDSLQEALLRAWRGLPRFEDRSSLRAWLYKISTNTCLDELARRPKRVLPIDFGPSAELNSAPGAPLAETVWVEPYPDAGLAGGLSAPEARIEQRESVELAFVAALQHLPALQRAVLILREVLGFSAQEVADVLDTTPAAVNSALQRARKAVDERLPDESQQATLRALGDERIRELVERYMRALDHGDVDALVAMLAEEATWSMPPLPSWYQGAEAIAALPRRVSLPRALAPRPDQRERAAGGRVLHVGPGARALRRRRARRAHAARAARSSRSPGSWRPGSTGASASCRVLMTPEAFRRFGLPDELPAHSAAERGLKPTGPRCRHSGACVRWQSRPTSRRAAHRRATLRIEELVHRDPVTGLANRAQLPARPRAAWDQARRAGRQIALLSIDLDDFKRVNDRHGHDVGDALLRAVAERLRKFVRPPTCSPARAATSSCCSCATSPTARAASPPTWPGACSGVLRGPFEIDERRALGQRERRRQHLPARRAQQRRAAAARRPRDVRRQGRRQGRLARPSRPPRRARTQRRRTPASIPPLHGAELERILDEGA